VLTRAERRFADVFAGRRGAGKERTAVGRVQSPNPPPGIPRSINDGPRRGGRWAVGRCGSPGNFEGAARDANGNPVLTAGRYITIWRKQGDGSWKVVLERGANRTGRRRRLLQTAAELEQLRRPASLPGRGWLHKPGQCGEMSDARRFGPNCASTKQISYLGGNLSVWKSPFCGRVNSRDCADTWNRVFVSYVRSQVNIEGDTTECLPIGSRHL